MAKKKNKQVKHRALILFLHKLKMLLDHPPVVLVL